MGDDDTRRGLPVAFRAFDFARDVEWVRAQLRPVFCEDTRGIVAERGGIPVAVILWDTWTATSAQSHIWIGWPLILRHGFLEEAAEYFYNTTGRRIMFGLTPSDRKKALRLNKKIGFRVIGILKDAHNEGIDIVVHRMDRDECKWLRKSDGREKRRASGT